jgi:ATP-dependent DNA helicase RecQ
MLDYADETVRCRMQVIQEYFNDPLAKACGICDICLARKKNEDLSAYEELRDEIINIIKQRPLPVEELEEIIAPRDRELFVDIVREMVDAGVLHYDEAWKLKLTHH